jgi:hypothetical protein
MKNALLLLFAFLTSAVLLGQDRKNNFFVRAEVGHATTGSGDLPGQVYALEGGKYFTRHFKVGLGVNHARMADEKTGFYAQSRATGVDLTLYADLLRIGFFNLELGAGGVYRNWHWTYETGPDQNFSTDKLRLGPSSRGSVSEGGVGYTASVGMNFQISPRVSASVRTTYQNDTNANNFITLRPGIIVNL